MSDPSGYASFELGYLSFPRSLCCSADGIARLRRTFATDSLRRDYFGCLTRVSTANKEWRAVRQTNRNIKRLRLLKGLIRRLGIHRYTANNCLDPKRWKLV